MEEVPAEADRQNHHSCMVPLRMKLEEAEGVEYYIDFGARLVLPNIPSLPVRCFQRHPDLPVEKWMHRSTDSRTTNSLDPRPNYPTVGDGVHDKESQEVMDASNFPSVGASHGLPAKEAVADMGKVHPSYLDCCSRIPSFGLRWPFGRKNQEVVVEEENQVVGGVHPHWYDDTAAPCLDFQNYYFVQQAQTEQTPLAEGESAALAEEQSTRRVWLCSRLA